MQSRITGVAAISGLSLLPRRRSLGKSIARGAFRFSSPWILWQRLCRSFEDRGRTPKQVSGSSREDWDEEVLMDMGW